MQRPDARLALAQSRTSCLSPQCSFLLFFKWELTSGPENALAHDFLAVLLLRNPKYRDSLITGHWAGCPSGSAP